jgi:WD40 repeat protein
MATSYSFALPKSHDGDIVDIQFDNTGNYLASCALDGTVAVYDLSHRRYIHRFEIDQTPSCMSWAHAEPRFFSIIVGSTNGNLCQVTFQQNDVCLPSLD